MFLPTEEEEFDWAGVRMLKERDTADRSSGAQFDASGNWKLGYEAAISVAIIVVFVVGLLAFVYQ
jgi:hypothetical protein